MIPDDLIYPDRHFANLILLSSFLATMGTMRDRFGPSDAGSLRAIAILKQHAYRVPATVVEEVCSNVSKALQSNATIEQLRYLESMVQLFGEQVFDEHVWDMLNSEAIKPDIDEYEEQRRQPRPSAVERSPLPSMSGSPTPPAIQMWLDREEPFEGMPTTMQHKIDESVTLSSNARARAQDSTNSSSIYTGGEDIMSTPSPKRKKDEEQSAMIPNPKRKRDHNPHILSPSPEQDLQGYQAIMLALGLGTERKPWIPRISLRKPVTEDDEEKPTLPKVKGKRKREDEAPPPLIKASKRARRPNTSSAKPATPILTPPPDRPRATIKAPTRRSKRLQKLESG